MRGFPRCTCAFDILARSDNTHASKFTRVYKELRFGDSRSWDTPVFVTTLNCLCDTAWLSASDPGLSSRAGVRFPDGDQGRMEDCVSVPLGFGDSETAGLCALVEARLMPGCVP